MRKQESPSQRASKNSNCPLIFDNSIALYTESLRLFVERFRLRKPKLDEEHVLRITGKRGFLIENGDGFLKGVFSLTVQTWNSARKRLEAEGIEIIQDGDFEGGFIFLPKNENHARLVIQLLKIPKKKILSEEQKKRLAEQLRNHSQTQAEGTYREQKPASDCSGVLEHVGGGNERS